MKNYAVLLFALYVLGLNTEQVGAAQNAYRLIDDTYCKYSIQYQAETFAPFVYEQLENNLSTLNDGASPLLNKASGETACFRAVSTESAKSAVDLMESDMLLADTDSDGVPELFAGTHGTGGTGEYAVYSLDGAYGEENFTWLADEFRIVNGQAYAPSGNGWYRGWTKLSKGLPSVHVQLTYPDTEAYDVDVRLADGSEKRLTGVTEDETAALFSEYLGVSVETIDNSENTVVYVRGCLEVPDPENYTLNDIKACIAELLEDYYRKAESDVPAYTDIYSSILFERLTAEGGYIFDNPYVPEYPFEVKPTASDSTSASESDIMVWDIDNDGVPELLAGNHGINGGMALNVISADGTDKGVLLCSSAFDFFETDGGIYTYSGVNSMPVYTRISAGLPSVKFIPTGDGVYSAELYSGGKCTDSFEGIDESRLDQLLRSHIGLERESIGQSREVDIHFAEGILKVPDPENYTLNDIRACIAELMEDYYDLK